jgi:hypothetical protein
VGRSEFGIPFWCGIPKEGDHFEYPSVYARVMVQVNGRVHFRAGHEGQRVSRVIALIFL